MAALISQVAGVLNKAVYWDHFQAGCTETLPHLSGSHHSRHPSGLLQTGGEKPAEEAPIPSLSFGCGFWSAGFQFSFFPSVSLAPRAFIPSQRFLMGPWDILKQQQRLGKAALPPRDYQWAIPERGGITTPTEKNQRVVRFTLTYCMAGLGATTGVESLCLCCPSNTCGSWAGPSSFSPHRRDTLYRHRQAGG